ncbi:hypothetical protein ACKWTF_000849 [Chironomus riparius]
MTKINFEVPFRLMLLLFLGIILGISLSTIFLYSKKFSITLNNPKPKSNPVDVRNARSFTLNQYNRSLADELTRDVRVLCWVLTMPENHKKKAIHVKNTWGKRCTKLLFMSTTADSNLNTIGLPVQETRSSLWDKTRFALQYVYNYHFDEADWFLKADDDSYFIMENVRYMLSQYHSKTSLYFGHRYASIHADSGYMAGGGYILSKKALEKFVTKLMHDKDNCKITNEGAEDLELGKCFENQTLFIDDRDKLKQKRFFPAGIMEHINPKTSNNAYWYNRMLYYDSKYGGLECCSDLLVNLHYINPREMYMLEHLFYKAHPFGLDKNSTETLPPKISLNEIIKSSDEPSNATEFKNYKSHHIIHHIFEEDEKFK